MSGSLLDEATPLPWRDHFCKGTDGGDECWQPDPHHDLYHPDPDGDGTYGVGGADIMCVDEDCPEVALILHAVNRLPDYEAALDSLSLLLRHFPQVQPGSVAEVVLDEARAALARLRGAA